LTPLYHAADGIGNTYFSAIRNVCSNSYVTLLLMQEQQQQEVGEMVRTELAKRNMSFNSASTRLDIDRGTLTKWAQGKSPSVEVVEKFARKLGLDVNLWRIRNGYDPVVSAAEHFFAGLAALNRKHGRPFAIDFNLFAERITTIEVADQVLADIDQQAREGII
jgi:transcriptional regulator with XRE-family HTH domain